MKKTINDQYIKLQEKYPGYKQYNKYKFKKNVAPNFNYEILKEIIDFTIQTNKASFTYDDIHYMLYTQHKKTYIDFNLISLPLIKKHYFKKILTEQLKDMTPNGIITNIITVLNNYNTNTNLKINQLLNFNLFNTSDAIPDAVIILDKYNNITIINKIAIYKDITKKLITYINEIQKTKEYVKVIKSKHNNDESMNNFYFIFNKMTTNFIYRYEMMLIKNIAVCEYKSKPNTKK